MHRDRKKEHKKIIKYMRTRNKQLAADDYIGIDRFRIDLYSESWRRYADGSGGLMSLIFEMTDTWTGNTAYFVSNNYGYKWDMFECLNDFLVRCSTGHPGHLPSLHYVAYDVHEIIPYAGRKTREFEVKEGVINTYSWLKGVVYE